MQTDKKQIFQNVSGQGISFMILENLLALGDVLVKKGDDRPACLKTWLMMGNAFTISSST